LDQRDQALTYSPDLKWVACALVIAAVTFNALLCVINMHVAPIHNYHVVGSEMFIITMAMLACYRAIEPHYALIIAFIIVYTLGLAFTRGFVTPDAGINLKITRDLLIPVIFLLLGKRVGDIRFADTVVYVATGLILFFAIFEFLFLDAYLRVFSIIEYYVARGTLEAVNPALQWANGLMLNGIRPPEQGRVLLSFLGEHRISSLFLEAISLGNFGCLVAFWAIVRSRMEGQWRIWLFVAGIALIILSDSRFNASFLGVGILILLLSPRVTTPVVLAMPFVAMAALHLAAGSADPHQLLLEGQSLKDRLLFSGGLLLNFDIYNWLGFAASPTPTEDSGYAYVISSVGLLGFAAFWFWFISLGGRSRYFCAFRNAIAAYFATLFCISSSQFTIKTAALLWFLTGALSVAQSRDAAVLARS
jgi:putative polymerase